MIEANEQFYEYKIIVAPTTGGVPMVAAESLYTNQARIYDSHPKGGRHFSLLHSLTVYPDLDMTEGWQYSNQKPILAQITDRPMDWFPDNRPETQSVHEVLAQLASMRFLDLDPDAMRLPSFPGQNVLGDRGENLSSVLQAICQEERGKQTLLSWLQELTPMDAADFEFPTDQIGRVLLVLVEKNGQKTTAYSASDGTLRFLAMIAALLGPESARFYFFEELDNGIHPTRLHLLLQLIEQQANKGKVQVVATTHSSALLRLLSPQSLEYVSVIYRSPESPAARIVRLLDLPDARRLAREQDVANLFESGWLEDAIAFQEAGEVAV